MAAMSLRWLVAGSAWLPAALAANMGAERQYPAGPGPTAAPVLKEAAIAISPRVLTAAPHARDLLRKRATNTCGYELGNSSQCRNTTSSRPLS